MSVKKNAERDAAIARRYTDGDSLVNLCKDFGLTSTRIYQILNKAGVPRLRHLDVSERDQFLGINLSESVKTALRAEAERRGVSMSSLSSTILREMLLACGYPIEAEQVTMLEMR